MKEAPTTVFFLFSYLLQLGYYPVAVVILHVNIF